MPLDTKILLDKIKKLKDSLDTGMFADALVGSLNTGNALMQNRIFGDNRDIEGNGFGLYVGKKRKARLLTSKNKTTNKRLKRIAGQLLTAHQRKRAIRGRKINPKDLELEGDLRRSIKTVVVDERSAAIEFENDLSAKIARGQENQITNIRNGRPGLTTGDGIRIFRLSDEEKGDVNEQLKLLIGQILK